jgi:hypothetical protein
MRSIHATQTPQNQAEQMNKNQKALKGRHTSTMGNALGKQNLQKPKSPESPERGPYLNHGHRPW